MTLMVAAAQFAAASDKVANRDTIRELVGDAAARGAELVVLPENAMYSHPDFAHDLLPIAESLDGAFVGFLQHLAGEHGVAIVAGMTELAASGEKVHNTVVAVDASGVLARYRKIHLYDAFGFTESTTVQRGEVEDGSTFDLGGLRLGLMTCYDLRFPESARRLVDQGADVLVVPAAWVAGPLKETHWETLLRARAIESTVYVVGAGQTGPVCVGASAIVDPAGVVAAAAGPTVGCVVAPLAASRLAEVRAVVPVLEHRRFRTVAIEEGAR